tara:strand:- start:8 stop:142 length:135 start_codon:yes stop_codon:yes gene_type:complete
MHAPKGREQRSCEGILVSFLAECIPSVSVWQVAEARTNELRTEY